MVSFEDLIIDIMVLPNGEYFILDEDELPESLGNFEGGYVKKALYGLKEIIQKELPQIASTNSFGDSQGAEELKFNYINILNGNE